VRCGEAPPATSARRPLQKSHLSPFRPPSLERHRGGGKGGESVIHPGLERSLLEARLVLLVDGIVCTSLPARVLLNRRPLCQHSCQPGAARCFACWRLRCSALLPRLVCSTLDAGLPPSHPSVHPIRSSRDIYYHPRRRPLGLVRSHASPPSTCPFYLTSLPSLGSLPSTSRLQHDLLLSLPPWPRCASLTTGLVVRHSSSTRCGACLATPACLDPQAWLPRP